LGFFFWVPSDVEPNKPEGFPLARHRVHAFRGAHPRNSSNHCFSTTLTHCGIARTLRRADPPRPIARAAGQTLDHRAYGMGSSRQAIRSLYRYLQVESAARAAQQPDAALDHE
jgi:hypothetical protein